MSINICFSVRILTVLKVLKTLESMAGPAVLKIVPWSSYSVVYLNSKSNQELSTWFVEAQRAMFANFLMEVLDACRNVGVEVVATVCHMGANSSRLWNSWMFLKRYQSSRWVTKKLQQCLNPVSLNANSLVIEHDVTNVVFEVFVNGERPSAQICWRGNKLTK
jgi:hypothetical protein